MDARGWRAIGNLFFARSYARWCGNDADGVFAMNRPFAFLLLTDEERNDEQITYQAASLPPLGEGQAEGYSFNQKRLPITESFSKHQGPFTHAFNINECVHPTRGAIVDCKISSGKGGEIPSPYISSTSRSERTLEFSPLS